MLPSGAFNSRFMRWDEPVHSTVLVGQRLRLVEMQLEGSREDFSMLTQLEKGIEYFGTSVMVRHAMRRFPRIRVAGKGKPGVRLLRLVACDE